MCNYRDYGAWVKSGYGGARMINDNGEILATVVLLLILGSFVLVAVGGV